MDILGGISGLVGSVGGLIQGGQQLKWDKEVQKKNWESQAEQQRYDRALQQTMFGREDSAYQRKADDLAKAGFNRLLAVGGSGAQAGPVVRSQAPQEERVQVPNIGKTVSEGIESMMGIMRQKADISRTVAENKLIEQNVRKEKMENDYWEKLGISRNSSNIGKTGGIIATIIDNLTDKASGGFSILDLLTGRKKKK